MKVLLVTSWNVPHCGIQEHSRMLIDAVNHADPTIEMLPDAASLDPSLVAERPDVDMIDVIHLNFHRALHSRWTPAWVKQWQDLGAKVVITFHDTVGEEPPDQLTRDLYTFADAFIVHEPCLDLQRALFWRMGIPATRGDGLETSMGDERLVLGTLGFDFPWKNFDRLAEITAEVGWGLLVVTPQMAEDHQLALKSRNPWTEILTGADSEAALLYLRGCDATAVMYTCGNSGQSGAITNCIAARKPVYALETCRQFRAYQWTNEKLRWVQSFEQLRERLVEDQFPRLDPFMVDLAERDSWTKLGAKYAQLYRGLV